VSDLTPKLAGVRSLTGIAPRWIFLASLSSATNPNYRTNVILLAFNTTLERVRAVRKERARARADAVHRISGWAGRGGSDRWRTPSVW
jgi:hypothetical protein